MELSVLGTLVQTVGAILLALIFFYLSRESGSRVLTAAAWGWLFLFLSLASLIASMEYALPSPLEKLPYQYFKLLYLAALVIAADRLDHDFPIGRRLGIAALSALPVSLAVVYGTGSGSLFYAVHMAFGAVAWFAITVLILRSRGRGLGRQFSALLAVITTLAEIADVVLFALSAQRGDRPVSILAYIGFEDLFLEMLFGIGLIIWAMEDTEARLAMVHARTVEETQRTKRRAQLDPLTEAHNRFFLEEIRSSLTEPHSSGSIVLIDVDGLKTINDTEGHEEGDKAIWTIATAIKKLIRGNDYLIRWGGDEFLVVLPGMDEALAKKRFYMLPARIEEVRQSTNLPRAYRKFLAASVGVTPYSSRAPFSVAIEQADRVMYERKKALKQMRGVPPRRDTQA
ncbi:MAG TPA: GGDEF domain-containing protein [Thermoanaerobaculia bacterium]|nr:GGDEF domain-containing protein [Thermoanaerobaculia bacterium]